MLAQAGERWFSMPRSVLFASNATLFQCSIPNERPNRTTSPRCLVPSFDGAFLSRDSKEALWDKFCTAAPTTTEAIRRAIQNSQESLRALAKRYGINQKTVAKWKKRGSVVDLPTGPTEARSTVLSVEDEAIIVAFRRHTLLPLDDCLYALQPTIPHLTRSSLHRCPQRSGITRRPEAEGAKPSEKKFKTYPIGFFHIDIAEVQTAEGKLYLFVAIDRTSKFALSIAPSARQRNVAASGTECRCRSELTPAASA